MLFLSFGVRSLVCILCRSLFTIALDVPNSRSKWMDNASVKTFVFTPEYLLVGIRYHWKPWTIIHKSGLSHLNPEMEFVFQRLRRSISLWLSLLAVRGPDLGATPRRIGWGCAARFQNPYPIYDQNLQFSLPYLWPDKKNGFPIYDRYSWHSRPKHYDYDGLLLMVLPIKINK